MRTGDGESGQAGVEFLALLPLVAVVLLAAWQAAVAGQAWWLAASAARAGARAATAGTDVGAAVRRELPAGLRARVRVHRTRGAVRVALPVAVVLAHARLGSASARAGVQGAAP